MGRRLLPMPRRPLQLVLAIPRRLDLAGEQMSDLTDEQQAAKDAARDAENVRESLANAGRSGGHAAFNRFAAYHDQLAAQLEALKLRLAEREALGEVLADDAKAAHAKVAEMEAELAKLKALQTEATAAVEAAQAAAAEPLKFAGEVTVATNADGEATS
jgi:DNA repair exonuclease SbcCD ATPase subunit